MPFALGIFREILHSPEREFDDAEILRLTGKALSEKGWSVVLKKPEEIWMEKESLSRSLPELMFVMCEQEKILELLKAWQAAGSVIVNVPDGILNTYRVKTLPLLQKANLPFPKSEIILTSNHSAGLDEKIKDGKIWIKRSDVHNTQKGDVALIETAEQLKNSLKIFQDRGIASAVLQKHVDGDLIKFYGIGDPSDADSLWFKWFYHKNQDLKKYAFSQTELKQITSQTARCLGLEIYGGDGIVSDGGKIHIIDINAWPSFALFRDEASKAIAAHLDLKMKKLQKAGQR